MSDAAAAAAAAFLAASGGAPPAGSSSKAKKKKNKKKATTGDEVVAENDETKPKKKEAKPQNAMAKLVLERRAKEKEEAEKRKEQEEELQRQQDEEERLLLEEERLIQEKKDQKKREQKEIKEKLRAEGKAVTKAEKAKEAKALAARERLVAQGLIQLDEDGNPIPLEKKKLEQKKKKPVSKPKVETPAPVVLDQEEEEVEAVDEVEKEVAQLNLEFDAPDDWDASDNDDWDLGDKILQIKEKIEEVLDKEEEVVEDDMAPIISTAQPKKKEEPKTKNAQKKKGKKKRTGFTKLAHSSDDESDDSDSEGESEDDENGGRVSAKETMRLQKIEKEKQMEEARERREQRQRENLMKRSKDDLRSPICCVMGHVDTGKTKLLDKIRKTNVQDGEAGGITQQIGATYFPIENLRKATDKLNKDLSLEYKIPGMLVIDTPGHESFSNLRNRGSSLCDIAILVIDIMHGLEQQTIESINMLRNRKTPFIVALNKVDRLYGWKPIPGAPIRESLKQQDDHVIQEFETRSKQVITQLMEQSLNATLYYDNKDYKRVVSLVPTSAHSGEGIPDMLLLLVQLTQRMMVERLMFSETMEATVLDVKKIEGVGTTIDVVLVNGKLRQGDTIVVAGMNGPIVTQIRALLTPAPMKELRVKGEYIHHEELKAAIGIKIAAQHLEDAIAGTSMLLFTDEDDEDELRESVMEDISNVMGNVSTTGRGVCVQASTLGSLEALMEFLRTSDIPVASVQIGPVHRKDVMRASIMLEHQKEFAVILAFDVKVTKEAQEHADDVGVRIFTADIIYHLFDYFTNYMKDFTQEKREGAQLDATFPCQLRVIPSNVFMKRNPLVLGVDILDGICKIGTPLVVPDRLIPDDANPGQTKMLEIGRIISIQKDGVDADLVKKGNAVCIKIQGTAAQSYVTYGRHFDETNLLYSQLSRKSIDALKDNFKDDLQKADWQLVMKLKPMFGII